MSAALKAAFLEQATHCEALDSPFMGRLLRLLAARWPEGSALADKLAAWPGDLGPLAASLPLRVAGGLHALRLSGRDAGLDAAYPPSSLGDEDLWRAVADALARHDAFLCDWVDHAPQTNEVRRAGALIAGAHLVAGWSGLPLRLSELGASGGLNLMFDRFALHLPGASFGPHDAAVTLSPDWQGSMPAPAGLRIADRGGVDLNPIDAHAPEGALRLQAYLWPDQAERLHRTRAAIALQDAPVDRGDAIDWLQTRLPPVAGHCHLIYHTIAWQYFPAPAQKRGRALIEAAGATATAQTPLAWLSMEADASNRPGAALHLRLWPGDLRLDLGRVDFHGRWIDWRGPSALS